MRSIESGVSVAPTELTAKKERDRTSYWKKKFVGALAPYWAEDYRLTQTQEPKIRELISTVISHVPTPGEVLQPIISHTTWEEEEYGGDLWGRLDDLMRATEQVTGSRHRYTPHEFAESLRRFSDSEVAHYAQVDAAKRAGQEQGREVGLSEAQRDVLKTQVDQILEAPNFIEAHTRAFGPKYSVFPFKHSSYYWDEYQEKHIEEERIFLTNPYLTREERSRVNGQMRSADTCLFQSEYLLEQLPNVNPDLGFLYAEGNIFPYNGVQQHEILLVAPDNATKDHLADLQDKINRKRVYPLLSIEAAEKPETPSLADITVIDPSVLQIFENISFLADMPYEERIVFVQSIAPGSFSKDGVFVDTYTKYIQFLGLISSMDPQFYVQRQSFRSLRRKMREENPS